MQMLHVSHSFLTPCLPGEKIGQKKNKIVFFLVHQEGKEREGGKRGVIFFPNAIHPNRAGIWTESQKQQCVVHEPRVSVPCEDAERAAVFVAQSPPPLSPPRPVHMPPSRRRTQKRGRRDLLSPPPPPLLALDTKKGQTRRWTQRKGDVRREGTSDFLCECHVCKFSSPPYFPFLLIFLSSNFLSSLVNSLSVACINLCCQQNSLVVCLLYFTCTY